VGNIDLTYPGVSIPFYAKRTGDPFLEGDEISKIFFKKQASQGRRSFSWLAQNHISPKPLGLPSRLSDVESW
jgi:hypothetical protein